ncbi:hemolysin III family protein, partial [Phocaeicola dorei]
VPPVFIYWLIGEGVSYITGAVFYSFPQLPYMHSVFHLFVLGGTICHMMALWYIL